MSEIVGLLAWVRGTFGYEPQKWPIDMPLNNAAPPAVAIHKLTAEVYRLPLNELAGIYPAPKLKDDA